MFKFFVYFSLFISFQVYGDNTCSSKQALPQLPSSAVSSFKEFAPMNSPDGSTKDDSKTMMEINLIDPHDYSSPINQLYQQHRKYYLDIFDIAKKYHKNSNLCRNKLESYYRYFSPWKGLSFDEKMIELSKVGQMVYFDIKLDELIHHCYSNVMELHYPKVKLDITNFFIQKIEKHKLSGISIFRYFINKKLKKIPLRPFSILTSEKNIYIRWPSVDQNEYELEILFKRKNKEPTIKSYAEFFTQLMWPTFVLSLERVYAQQIKNYVHMDSLIFPFRTTFLHNTKLNCGHLNDIVSSYTSIKMPEQSLRSNKKAAYTLHPSLNPHIIRCIAKQEVHSLNPLQANYTFCASDERFFMRSTALGLGQTTFRTFNWLRSKGEIPLSDDGLLQPTSEMDNQFIFESVPTRVDLQIRIVFYHLNYLLKRNSTTSKAITKYDTDDQSRYIRNVMKCIECLKKYHYNEKDKSLQCTKSTR